MRTTLAISPPGVGTPQRFWWGGGGGGGCAAQTLKSVPSLFQTKICDFPYSISDLSKNSVPHFRPVQN